MLYKIWVWGVVQALMLETPMRPLARGEHTQETRPCLQLSSIKLDKPLVFIKSALFTEQNGV
jgi:hypothetical protein